MTKCFRAILKSCQALAAAGAAAAAWWQRQLTVTTLTTPASTSSTTTTTTTTASSSPPLPLPACHQSLGERSPAPNRAWRARIIGRAPSSACLRKSAKTRLPCPRSSAACFPPFFVLGDFLVSIRAAVARTIDEGAQSIVLDLRHNPGGFFPGGIDVARYGSYM